MTRTITINKPVEYVLTDAEYVLVRSMTDKKVAAILFIRRQHSLSYRDASTVCDAIWDGNFIHEGAGLMYIQGVSQ